MNKLDIFCFTSVARTKSFSLTARELMISQQAVSKHIRNMEDELGYQLFFRDSIPVELTKAGVYMLEYFTLRKGIIEDIKSEIEKNAPVLSMNIGFSQWTASPVWFLDIVKYYHELHPEIDIHLLNLDANELLHTASEQKADILVTSRYMTRYMPPIWKAVQIATKPLFIITSRGSTYIHDMLSLYPFFAVAAGESSDNAIKQRVINVCSKLGFTPQNIVTCNDMGTVMLNALLNRGVTIGCYPPERGIGKEYNFEKTDLIADIVMCIPHQGASPYAEELASYILEQTGDMNHE